MAFAAVRTTSRAITREADMPGTFWDSLSESSRTILLTSGVQRVWPRGYHLTSQDRVHIEHVYVILEGRARAYTTTPDGEETTLDVLHQGEVAGELEVIDPNHRLASVAVVSRRARVLQIPAERFHEIVLSHPDVALELLRSMAQRLRRANEMRAATRTEGRVMRALQQHARSGARTSDGVIIHITQDDLAKFAQASRKTVQRVMAKLRRQGVVDTDRKRIVLRRWHRRDDGS
ncbi:Crp/Fnr family transcriptional regulator [Thermoactinospora rubra]|uniref:Crp/Fnr family transcriptional regulator n=1 Tax=Thermoactinospora rubra TaxID=1088767 RepID=UPI000A122F04|nr:Crp/Fnr family transcriptional regulator [Thermoactinospora rubra]